MGLDGTSLAEKRTLQEDLKFLSAPEPRRRLNAITVRSCRFILAANSTTHKTVMSGPSLYVSHGAMESAGGW
jgi:hypothetical protein